MINKVILVGDVWKAPVEKTTIKNDNTMCILYLVTKEYILDKNNTSENKVYTEKKEWHTVTIFGKLAKYVLTHIEVGDVIFVQGQIRTSEITKDGVKEYIRNIVVDPNGMVKKLFNKKVKSNSNIDLTEDSDTISTTTTDTDDTTLQDDDLLF